MSVSLSLMEACMIEALLKKGMTANVIVNHIHEGDVQSLNNFDETFDYSYLVEKNQNNVENISHALNKSYKVKFVTENGLKTLLRLKFGYEEERDYHLANSQFALFSIKEDELHTLENLLSINWKITIDEKITDGSYRITIFNPSVDNM